ncbi:MAG: 3-hydroxyacyl-CoA dehydrogenase [Gammaproteobacteria bacterium]|nr:3-hydroxyacyl-CoA dehydrogenase [Gammaproteobacteria bacterium]
MTNQRVIKNVAVIGSGTMGAGIAALCANAGCRTLLLDIDKSLADKAVERMQGGRSPMLDDPKALELLNAGSIDDDLDSISDYNWICEVVVENLDIKRDIFTKIENARSDGSIVTTNTSGIPLRSIYAGMPQRLRNDIAVTHFFNPVKIMRLVELVPGEDTTDDVKQSLADFLGKKLGKGVVHAKDTVNFIGNRIGCYWILAGLHKGKIARQKGLSMETIDALMSTPMGFPPTGLYGLADLIGLDVMGLVAANLVENLPKDDAGREFTSLPVEEQAMLDDGQLGRKTGGGFYRVTKNDDGSKLKETFNPDTKQWAVAQTPTLDAAHSGYKSLMFSNDEQGQFAWDVMSSTLCYAADLIPEISDDVVNIDRAMRWGFAWARGPFEMLDALGSQEIIQRLNEENRAIPSTLKLLVDSGNDSFYQNNGAEYFGVDGQYHAVPPEK